MSTLVKRNGNGFWPSASLDEDFLGSNLLRWPNLLSESNAVPRVNIAETDEDFKVELAAPGMKREDFHVELDNDTLTIWTEQENNHEEENKNFTRREFSYQSFKRSFHLPITVESDKIEAKYTDGLLMLTIPKKEEAKKKPVRTIEIS